MKKELFPILEYDALSTPIVRPKNYVPDFINEKSDKCLITYFSDVVERWERSFKVNQAFKIRTEGVRPRVFYSKVGPRKEIIYIVPMPLGAPEAARIMEIMSSIGVKKFMICGGAGTLDDSVTQNKVLVPVSAVRDEGTSYHYLPPSREVEINPRVLEKIEQTLKNLGEQYVCVKTWTTDAIFRETDERVKRRKSEGCSVVEMECSAFYSVAKHMGFLCGQLLYAGDIVRPGQWHYRDWHTAFETREKLFNLAIECLLTL